MLQRWEGGERLMDGKVGCTFLSPETRSSFLSSQLFKSEMKNFQNSSVYSRVPSYWQTLKKSQTRRLWNKPRVLTRPVNTSVVVNVSSFPCLDLPFRNDSICLALGYYLVTWDSLFSEARSCKRILQKEREGQRSVGSCFAGPAPAWP